MSESPKTAREQIAEAVKAARYSAAEARDIADALAPLVERIAADKAAQELDAARLHLLGAFREGASVAGSVPGWIEARAAQLRTSSEASQ